MQYYLELDPILGRQDLDYIASLSSTPETGPEIPSRQASADKNCDLIVLALIISFIQTHPSLRTRSFTLPTLSSLEYD